MTQKYQRPSGSYSGQSGLSNRAKYIDDANATPKRAISSNKVDGDFNYLIDAVNQIDDASGSRASIAERLDVSLNTDGTLKVSVAGALDEWVVHQNPGTIARLDNSTFTLAGGNYTALYPVNRRVQIMVNGVALVGDVASSSFAGGLTTVSLVDILTPALGLGVIDVAPTQVAYGPLTPGPRGNMPRRTDELDLTTGSNTFSLGNDANDLAIRRNGTIVSRVGAGGLSGLSAGSVALASLATGVAEALNPTGSLAPFAGASAPSGWLLCAGQTVSRTTFSGLFAVIGTTYGAGDGSTTFGIPDLRGRTVFGLDNMGGTATNRLTSGGSGVQGTVLGASGGHQSLQSHTHTVTDPGHSHDAWRAGGGYTSGGGAFPVAVTNPGLGDPGFRTGSGTAVVSATTGITVASTGNGGAQNMPPALVLNWIIKA